MLKPENFTADMFNNPDLFHTEYDTDIRDESTYAHRQYLKALGIAATAHYISIGINNVWSAYAPSVMHSSYERIGYHADTYALLKGFLDSGKLIKVFRIEDDKIVEHHINTAALYMRD